MVQDIISYQIKKASSHEKKEFEKTLEGLIPVISQSKVSMHICMCIVSICICINVYVPFLKQNIIIMVTIYKRLKTNYTS